MKTKIAATVAAVFFSQYGLCAQDVMEARSDALGGVGVASASLQASVWLNPALMSLPEYQTGEAALLIPVLGGELSDKDKMADKFDDVEAHYDGLEAAINNLDVDGIDKYRGLLLSDLESLDGNIGYASAGLGITFAMPSSRISWGLYYKTFLDAIVIADIGDDDLRFLEDLDPENAPALEDLTSQGRVVAGAQTDFALALSIPLSVVNMPVTVGLTPKLQRIDGFNYAVSANNFDAGDFNSDDYRNDETGFNLDAGVAIRPLENLTLGIVGRNLIENEVDLPESEGLTATYRVGPMVTLGASYRLGAWQFSSDLDLTDNEKFVGLEGTKYWRLGTEWQALDWLALRAGYRQDLNDMTADIYSLGTGFSIGSSFKVDLAGMWRENDTLGAVLQTSYHF